MTIKNTRPRLRGYVPIRRVLSLLLIFLTALYFVTLYRLHRARRFVKVLTDDPRLIHTSIARNETRLRTEAAVAAAGPMVTEVFNGSVRASNEATTLSERDGKQRPSLRDLIDAQGNITGDVSWLLDYAIIGFGKCGTSTLLSWLDAHPAISCYPTEVWEQMVQRPHRLVEQLYHRLPANATKRCFKSPGEITQPHILEYYRKYWTKTRLIIAVRRPIDWFHSLYNFRAKVLGPYVQMPHPKDCIGRCHAAHHLTCTEKGNFARMLLQLGKQRGRAATRLEQQIVSRTRATMFNVSNVPRVPNPVFLLEMSQLNEPEHELQLRKDMTAFLGLDTLLPAIPHLNRAHDELHNTNVFMPTRGGALVNSSNTNRNNQTSINLCDAEHHLVRRELLFLATQTSEWIVSTFLNYPDVHSSNREHLDKLFAKWKVDPCQIGVNNHTTT